ncbi:uroporphyrinogen-III synthase [Erythrobacter mangrovi]|uniref:Uroporphyrinogen-III synthase n=1 Tax=Erythrobacter mangrovi TaxID=2739433 RepID=A0A7D4CP07_9SPHN|nr:uroporphyrinogen-III synthase [Erythrobacter mangrovi]QKG72468.1 uroporphyrinogen-III synthase [Erythrobacter mangrovi]
MTPLFLFRPEPGWTVSADTARAMGLEVRGAPLFEIEPVEWETPDPALYDGLLLGSANALRHGGKALEDYRSLPVHAVGDATAEAARAAGFLMGQVGRGGLQTLLDSLAGRELHLLRLAGEDRVPLAVPDGIRIDTRVVYRAVPRAIEEADAQALALGGVVALHSGAAARRFAEEFDRLGLARSLVTLVVIGPRVAEAAGEGWQSVHIADAPGDSEILALAKALCQTPPVGKGGAHE